MGSGIVTLVPWLGTANITPIARTKVPTDPPIALLPHPCSPAAPHGPRHMRALLAADGFVWQRGAGVAGHHVPAVPALIK